MSGPLIVARGLSKSYPLVSRRDARLRALGRLLFTKRSPEAVQVLKPLDLVVARGQSTAIIGENGAGKSTLLKLITGVLTPSTGTVVRNGSVGALLELGAGFHPDYSGRENMRMAAALAGLTPAQLQARLPEIIDFADIGRYIDEPIKHYSSGMVVRLGFAIVAALRPDLLITDEVLAVGDESFQKKCIAWMENYLAHGGTLLLVSHGMYHVQKLCRQAIWLKDGTVAAQGDVFDVSQAYLAYHERKRQQQAERGALPGEDCRIDGYRINGEADVEHATPDAGAGLDIEVDIRVNDDRPSVLLVGISHGNGLPVYGVSSEMRGVDPVRVAAGLYRFNLRVALDPLLPGEYILRLHSMDQEGLRLFETRDVTVLIRGATREFGVVRLQTQWQGPAKPDALSRDPVS